MRYAIASNPVLSQGIHYSFRSDVAERKNNLVLDYYLGKKFVAKLIKDPLRPSGRPTANPMGGPTAHPTGGLTVRPMGSPSSHPTGAEWQPSKNKIKIF